MINKKVDVVFTIDEKYIQHFCVALTSLLENNLNNTGKIFLIHDINKNSKLLNITLEYFLKRYDKEIILKTFSSSVFDSFLVYGHISKATYFRLLLPEILPLNLNDVLFLDSDIVVNGDISEILKYNFKLEEQEQINVDKNLINDIEDEYYIYAVDHLLSNIEIERIKELGMKSGRYFNAGVMWINLNYWRSKQVSKRAFEFVAKYNNKLNYWDQDVLNAIIDGKYGEMPHKYNVFENNPGIERLLNLSKLSNSANSEEIILHFIGTIKPWLYRFEHPYKNIYSYYLNMTPFKNTLPEDFTLKNIIKKNIPEELKPVSSKIFQIIKKLFETDNIKL